MTEADNTANDTADSTAAGPAAHDAAAVLVYDGACPFCTRFATMVRLRAAVGAVALVDAREGGPLIERLRAKGIDLDEGNVFSYGGRDYVGAEAMQAIATLTGLDGAFGRMVAWMIRKPGRARLLYPVLRGLRNLMLRLKGEPQLGELGETGEGPNEA
jgi:predicted DCC family thiol-disulfide oxidoreductase YuxK